MTDDTQERIASALESLVDLLETHNRNTDKIVEKLETISNDTDKIAYGSCQVWDLRRDLDTYFRALNPKAPIPPTFWS